MTSIYFKITPPSHQITTKIRCGLVVRISASQNLRDLACARMAGVRCTFLPLPQEIKIEDAPDELTSGLVPASEESFSLGWKFFLGGFFFLDFSRVCLKWGAGLHITLVSVLPRYLEP